MYRMKAYIIHSVDDRLILRCRRLIAAVTSEREIVAAKGLFSLRPFYTDLRVTHEESLSSTYLIELQLERVFGKLRASSESLTGFLHALQHCLLRTRWWLGSKI